MSPQSQATSTAPTPSSPATGSAPNARSWSTTWVWPRCQATCTGVLPLSLRALMSAPAATSAAIELESGRNADIAECRGVSPSVVRSPGSAPSSRSRATLPEVLDSPAARCNGVSPLSVGRLMSTPAPSRSGIVTLPCDVEYLARVCSSVPPVLSPSNGSAPASRSALMTTGPVSVATRRGVRPPALRALGSAPRSRSLRVTSERESPLIEALRGVPKKLRASMSAPASNRASTTPAVSARWSAVPRRACAWTSAPASSRRIVMASSKAAR